MKWIQQAIAKRRWDRETAALQRQRAYLAEARKRMESGVRVAETDEPVIERRKRTTALGIMGRLFGRALALAVSAVLTWWAVGNIAEIISDITWPWLGPI